MNVYVKDLIWQADFNGYEVGHDDVGVVGVWQSEELGCMFDIDAETGAVLAVHVEEEE